MPRSPEKRYRRKPHSGRRRKDSESRHWLGAGALGKESLLLDIDGFLYAIDSVVARLVSSVAHSYDGDQERPFALFLPPTGQIGWQIVQLSKHCNVYLWADSDIEELEEAKSRFDVEWIAGDLESEISHYLDLFLAAEHQWQHPAELFGCLQQVAPLLAAEGRAAFVLQAEGQDGDLQVRWADGSLSPLDELLAERLSGMKSPVVFGRSCLSEIDPHDSERLGGFLKRNRSYFGKDTRELLAARLKEEDVAACFSADREEPLWVLLLVWEATPDY